MRSMMCRARYARPSVQGQMDECLVAVKNFRVVQIALSKAGPVRYCLPHNRRAFLTLVSQVTLRTISIYVRPIARHVIVTLFHSSFLDLNGSL